MSTKSKIAKGVRILTIHGFCCKCGSSLISENGSYLIYPQGLFEETFTCEACGEENRLPRWVTNHS